MDHKLATAIKAPERYLLNEMSDDQRLDFEAHYFVCDECADEIRSGEILACGIKHVGGEFPVQAGNRGLLQGLARVWRWLSPAVFIPAVAAMALAMFASYQSFVLVPGLRAMIEPQAVDDHVLRAVARGDEPVIKIDSGSHVTLLRLDVNSGVQGQPITWQLQSPDGKASPLWRAKIPAPGKPLELLIPNSNLERVGVWTLVLQTAQKEDAGRYVFRIE